MAGLARDPELPAHLAHAFSPKKASEETKALMHPILHKLDNIAFDSCCQGQVLVRVRLYYPLMEELSQELTMVEIGLITPLASVAIGGQHLSDKEDEALFFAVCMADRAVQHVEQTDEMIEQQRAELQEQTARQIEFLNSKRAFGLK